MPTTLSDWSLIIASSCAVIAIFLTLCQTTITYRQWKSVANRSEAKQQLDLVIRSITELESLTLIYYTETLGTSRQPREKKLILRAISSLKRDLNFFEKQVKNLHYNEIEESYKELKQSITEDKFNDSSTLPFEHEIHLRISNSCQKLVKDLYLCFEKNFY